MQTAAISFIVLACAGPGGLQVAAPPAPARAPVPVDNALVVQRIATDGSATTLATFGRADVPSIARLKDGRLLLAFQGFPADD
ncbi:MAG: hypothetical protein ACKPBA_07005, partial [Planctomycetota bacterium]